MSNLFDASQTATGVTHNGAVTNKSSLDACVDLFFLAGASRGKDIKVPFHKALTQDSELTGRMLLWLRDILQGAGEREQFRSLFKELIYANPILAGKILSKIPYTGIGRWDDVLVAWGTPLQDQAVSMIVEALNSGDALCAKWMPRRKKGKDNTILRTLVEAFTTGNLPYSTKEKIFRKKLSELSVTVEQQMCAKEWDKIDFNHVPSKAIQKNRKAFHRNVGDKYTAWLDSLTKGDVGVKVNAKATHPHNITEMVLEMSGWRCGIKTDPQSRALAEAQWKALPDYVAGSDEKIIPMVDVSGSMYGLPFTVAATLGAYFAQRNTGAFSGELITFTDTPSFIKIPQGLVPAVGRILHSPVGYSTNVEAAFKLILNTAKKANLSQEDLPTKILLISDMEFDGSRCIHGNSKTTFQKMQQAYEKEGYKLPQVVFWNVAGRQGNSPVTIHETGTALVSGFSPSILTAVMKGVEELSPVSVMMSKLNEPRYNLD